MKVHQNFHRRAIISPFSEWITEDARVKGNSPAIQKQEDFVDRN